MSVNPYAAQTALYANAFNTEEGRNMMQESSETKATLTASLGRVVGFTKSTEPGKISLAVPGDRAKMTPAQALILAQWLTKTANAQAESAAEQVAAPEPMTARQAYLRATLDTERRPRW
ncbi:hypothetical protein AB0I16_33325 [Streptomyces sp. NPDC050703]|uniref:hypothetical protein n=1 Tax=Streptomyces sp. NPDC050703 TaxID=3157218 RepID=UPI00342B44FE